MISWQRRTLMSPGRLSRELDQIIVDDAPYVVLFSTPILEAYRNNLVYPFTENLGGIIWFSGFPDAVRFLD